MRLIIKKISKFSIGGILNFLIKIGLTFFLTERLKVWYFSSYIITLLVLLIYGFYYNAYITFDVKNNQKHNFMKFSVIMILFLLLDGMLVRILTDFLGLYYLLSIVLVTFVLFFARFFTYNKFVFINKDNESQINGLFSLLIQEIRMKQILPFLKGNSSFLDIGSSLGEVIRYLPVKSYYVGIEGNHQFYFNAKKRYPNKNFINTYLTKENVNLLNINKKVDCIIALAVVEHMNNPVEIISALKRYLKKNGRIIITSPSKKARLILKIGSKIGLFMKEMDEHKNHFTKKELKNLVKSAGYNIEHYHSFEFGLNHFMVIRNN